MTKKRKIIISAVILLISLAIAAFVFGVFDKKDKGESKPIFYSQLTGKEVDQATSERPVLGVMIENSEEARPQTGLDSAGIVFEAVTEGGITRFFAMYQEDTPEIVGPVRSLREHFLDWAMGFDASAAHVGGSAEALQLSDQRKAKSLSQFKYTEPYYRDTSRAAPHNMYARIKQLQELQKELKHEKGQFPEIPRKADSPSTAPAAPHVTIDFSGPSFLAEFHYDQPTNSYTRHLAGSLHVDKDSGKSITVKNLVVIKTKGQTSGVDATGSGEALVFTDGNVQKVRWQKSSYQNRIKLIADDNSEVPLNRGDTWFAAVTSDRTVTY